MNIETDYEKIQEEGFARLNELIQSIDPYIPSSFYIYLSQIESILEDYIVLDLNWSKFLEQITFLVDSKELEKLKSKLLWLLDFLKDCDEDY